MGKLFIVPTPIGNLSDITLRALETLRKADLILAEDTRKTLFLLNHFEIKKTVVSHHKFNEHKDAEHWAEKAESQTIALVTDAGTPGISDPGYLLVKTCIERGVEVETLPGSTAFVPALVNSGLPCDKFIFEGFLPQKKGRQKLLKQLSEEERTIVFYESPFRLLKALEEIALYFGSERRISVSRELTKIYEETVRGTVTEVGNHFRQKDIKGEIVIVVEGIGARKKKKTEDEE
jgi:16S rRNA (cytidine1402-2'-O)-methyltransferase